jgi:hypothetical protein
MTTILLLTNSHRKHNILIYQTITIQAGFMVKETTIDKGKYSTIICYILFLIYSKLYWDKSRYGFRKNF